MIRNSVFLLLVFLEVPLLGQNLVPNPSFEQIKEPVHRFTDNDMEFENQVDFWTSPNSATPDLITPSFNERYISTTQAHSGFMMAGIQAKAYFGEYLSVKLSIPLQPHQSYHVEYWIRRADCIAPSIDKDGPLNENFGILFLSKAIKAPNAKMLYGNPQIRIDTQLVITDKEWVRMTEYFTPDMTLSHMYLGQFRKKGKDPVASLGYYFIDDISITKVSNFSSFEQGANIPTGTVIPMNDIYFKSGSAELKNKNSATSLNEIAVFLISNSSIRVCINGHTDSKGRKRSNKSLSEKRSKFIVKSLINLGVKEERMEWKGYGEDVPIANNETEEGRSKNRRVEIEVIE